MYKYFWEISKTVHNLLLTLGRMQREFNGVARTVFLEAVFNFSWGF